jgi:glutamate dehydrogenase/leucine dehydrogenase
MQTAELLDEYSYSEPKPLRVTEWHDPKSSSVGWLVTDSRRCGIAGGGVFMSSGATVEEARGIARTMSKKFAICPNPIGGAKAGIRCDLTDTVQRDEVLWRFLSEMRPELDWWVTAADIGTSDRVINWAVRRLTGRDMQFALYRHAAGNDQRALELSRRAADLYRVDMSSALSPPGAPHFEFEVPFIEAAVGFCVVQSIFAAYARLEPGRLAQERPLEDVRIAIQGAGAVGTGVMLYASRLGARIVAVSDAEGIVYHPDGLDVEGVLALRARETAGFTEEARPLAGKLLSRYLLNSRDERLQVVTDAQLAKPETGRDPKLAHLLENAESANVFVPAASRYVLDGAAVEIASAGMWRDVHPRLIVAGANNPFGVPCGRGPAQPPTATDIGAILRTIQNHGVIYVPDFRANGGTAQLFHCYASGELDWVLEGAPTGIPVLTAEQQQDALQTVSSRIWRAVNEDLELCTPSFLDLPLRAEERVTQQLSDLE